MREWLSGGAPPCQGGGRGFDSRLALLEQRKGTSDGCSFFFVSRHIRASKGSMSPLRSGRRRPRSFRPRAPRLAQAIGIPLRDRRRRPRLFRPRAPRLAHEIEIPLRDRRRRPRSFRPRAPRLALFLFQRKSLFFKDFRYFCAFEKVGTFEEFLGTVSFLLWKADTGYIPVYCLPLL